MPAEKKIGLIAGVFDMVHAGHVLALKDARAQCDYLIVALHTAPNDPFKNQPIMTPTERAIILRACRYVDEVVYYDTESELLELLTAQDIDFRFLGEDYRSRPITGANLPIETRFLPRGHIWSSSELRERVYKAEVARRRASPTMRKPTVGVEESAHAVR